MRSQILKSFSKCPFRSAAAVRTKTVSAHYVTSKCRDPAFERLNEKHKNLAKVIAIQDLILLNPTNRVPSVSVDFIARLSQKLDLSYGAPSFRRRYHHIFHIFDNPKLSQPFCRLTNTTLEILHKEVEVVNASLPVVADRLVRLLSMSTSKSLPLCAISEVWREFGLPYEFKDSVISKNPHHFRIQDPRGCEPHRRLLQLVDEIPDNHFTAAVDNWRMTKCKEDGSVDRSKIQYSFKHQYPPGMRLSKNNMAKVKEWQKLPYIGPYETLGETKRSNAGTMGMEKRLVALMREFLSLTVEKMVEVEKISPFTEYFGIDLNITDLFVDYPGIFYLSTKGRRHIVFLREAFERGRLVDHNQVYDIRRKLLGLVTLGRRRLPANKAIQVEAEQGNDLELQNQRS